MREQLRRFDPAVGVDDGGDDGGVIGDGDVVDDIGDAASPNLSNVIVVQYRTWVVRLLL
jgi:hypothetical protein